jgi:tRNA(Ile)-lysidine synthase TilS/MesJ
MSQGLLLRLLYILEKKKELNYSSNFKFLVIYITENLRWYSHIHYLCYNLNKVFYMIMLLRDIVSIHISRNICHKISVGTKTQYNFLGWRGKQQNSFYITQEGA